MTGRDYVGERCTLDGRDAIVLGRQNDFATIQQTKHPLAIEFSWTTVERIMDRGGNFKS